MAKRSTTAKSDEAPRRRRGRQSFVPTDEQRMYVAVMAAGGIPLKAIATVVGIHAETLAKHFREELDGANKVAAAKVVGSLFRQATGTPAEYDEEGNCIREEVKPNLGAAIFWLKTRERWTEPAKVIYTKPIDQMSEEEILEFLGGEPKPEELGTLEGVEPAGTA